eukprot:XP_011407477.1 PREDICTED: uncharacterized protein YJL213W-like [Amphimedon queenslandica]
MGLAIIGAKVWDADVERPYDATVVVEGNSIAAIHKGEPPADLPQDRIDGTGMTLMPGMVEGHCHPSFTGIASPPELGAIGPEEHTLLYARNLKLLLDHGFTSIFEAASAKPMLGVCARNAIESGIIIGPRMRAAGPEITVTAGLGDERKRHLYQESFGLVADGVSQMRRVTRECVRDGVDNLKINISGDEFVAHARAEITPIEEDELEAFVQVAQRFGKTSVAHARSSQSVKMAVKYGIDCIYHCDFADEEALDMLEGARESCFVGPAFGLVHNCVKEGEAYGMSQADVESFHLPRKFDACVATYQELRKRGVRVVIGGDYGFAFTPMGQNARDIEHFVNYFGYSPTEALRCATSVGAELMGMADRIGRIGVGYLADLLLIDGDPTADVGLLQHPDKIPMVMKDGVCYKDPRSPKQSMLGIVL